MKKKILFSSILLLVFAMGIFGFAMAESNESVPGDYTTSSVCNDSDGGDNVLVYGWATVSNGAQYDWCDYGQGLNKVREAYCVNETTYSTKVLDCPESAPYCNEGVCSTEYPRCTETDGGKDPLNRGKTTPARMKDHPGNTDYCQITSTNAPVDSCSGDDCSLREFYCTADWPNEYYENMPCSEGCVEGVCAGWEEDNETVCTDSDGGLGYTEKGKLVVDGNTYLDTCLDDHFLQEYFCDNPPKYYDNYYCSLGCEDGACIEESSNETQVGDIRIKGKLIDQLTGKGVSGAKLLSAYEFYPNEVITDVEGQFEFYVGEEFILKEGPGAGRSDAGASWVFYADCYGYSSSIVLQKDYEVWENGKLKTKYKLAYRDVPFDGEESVEDVTGKSNINIGKIDVYPRADISITSDMAATFNVMYKYKNMEGYNGPGNSNYYTEHYLTSALPLDYDAYIEFTDEQGNTYQSSTFTTPLSARCGIVTLDYQDGESTWSTIEKIEPSEETGPIKIPKGVTEETITSRLCQGCLRDEKCYPYGFRKSGEYCDVETNSFIEQFDSESTCENNFECSSNLCLSEKCVSQGLLKRILNWFKDLFG